MKFKTNLLNTIVSEYEEYNLCSYNIEGKRKDLLNRYAPPVAEEKLKEFIKSNEEVKQRYYNNIEKAYKKQLEPIKKEYDAMISGVSITDDIKLLNTPGVSLTTDELQYLADRYKEAKNPMMLRAIGKYADDKGMKVDYIQPISVGDKIKAVNEAYEYGKNYINSNDEGFSFALVQERAFPILDNKISG